MGDLRGSEKGVVAAVNAAAVVWMEGRGWDVGEGVEGASRSKSRLL